VTLKVVETLRSRWNPNPPLTYSAGFAAGIQEAIRTIENDPELKRLSELPDAVRKFRAWIIAEEWGHEPAFYSEFIELRVALGDPLLPVSPSTRTDTPSVARLENGGGTPEARPNFRATEADKGSGAEKRVEQKD
jgi:hypothetical protein